jgi:5-methylcytosine-specific restriction endonuclease McrA
VLNADFRPLSYFPLSTWNWQDAVKAVFLDRVSVLSEYEREVRSPSFSMRLPSVIALRDFIPSARMPAFTRFNVFLRDGFTCQYCEARRPAPELTFDHVGPRARGGRTSWENVVTACGSCNLRKGSRLPRECHMIPRQEPRRPTSWELQDRGRGFPPNYLHESWRDFLYWDSELEN